LRDWRNASLATHYEMLRQFVLLHVRTISHFKLQQRTTSDAFQPSLLQTFSKCDALPFAKSVSPATRLRRPRSAFLPVHISSPFPDVIIRSPSTTTIASRYVCRAINAKAYSSIPPRKATPALVFPPKMRRISRFAHGPPFRTILLRRLFRCCSYLLSNRDAPLDPCCIVPRFHSAFLDDLCRLFSPSFRFSSRDVRRVLHGDELRCSQCLVISGQCTRDHDHDNIRQQGLAILPLEATG
jgi:hypothetical protein